jgi:hypothetical protein
MQQHLDAVVPGLDSNIYPHQAREAHCSIQLKSITTGTLNAFRRIILVVNRLSSTDFAEFLYPSLDLSGSLKVFLQTMLKTIRKILV